MKVICCLALLALTVSASIVPEDQRVNGENGWYVPQEDGTFVWMDKDTAEAELEQLEAIEARGLISTNPISFRLYTRGNPNKGQVITTSKKSVAGSNFNPANPTRFVIHGWTQTYMSGMNKNIRQAWLDKDDVNVIVVDWARARSADYASSVVAVPKTGKQVATMIDYLASSFGMPMNQLYVIGHSLGAHVAGYAGKNVKSGQIQAIFGLDPALPLFSYDKPNKRLCSTDAFYVESIQTDGGQLGFLQPIGKGAFYPNGGRSQPGCFLDVTGACSHGRSTTYYAEAVAKDDFPTIKCSTYQDATQNSCGSAYSSVRMGADSNVIMGGGDFYVPVHSNAPYGYGN